MLANKIQIPLPKALQETNFDCGPAALFAICQYYTINPLDYNELVQLCATEADTGTEPKKLIKAAHKFGLKTKEYHNMTIEQLEKVLNSGKPVIVSIQAWGKQTQYKTLSSGHYAIAIGYDENRVYFEDPYVWHNKRGSLKKSEFLLRWQDMKKDGSVLKQYGIAVWMNKKNKEVVEVKSTKKIE